MIPQTVLQCDIELSHFVNHHYVGTRADLVVGEMFQQDGYAVIYPNRTSNPAWDFKAVKGSVKWLVQVKTDANNDGSFHGMTPEQQMALKSQAGQIGYQPIVIYFHLGSKQIKSVRNLNAK